MQYSCLLPQGPYLHAVGELKTVPCRGAGAGEEKAAGASLGMV